jgi:hypothetical protein
VPFNVVASSVSVKLRHGVFYAQDFGQDAQNISTVRQLTHQKKPLDAQFSLTVRQVDAQITYNRLDYKLHTTFKSMNNVNTKIKAYAFAY